MVDVPPHRHLDAAIAAWAPELAADVAAQLSAWRRGDFGPCVWEDPGAWRAAKPGAVVANVSGRDDLTETDFVHLRGLAAVAMGHCYRVTDAAFAHLTGIHTLIMQRCDQRTITEMHGCGQPTDAAFAHLRGIHTLNMSCCWQPAITDAAFAHLAGVHTLDMRYCTQPTITAAAFAVLGPVNNLIRP